MSEFDDEFDGGIDDDFAAEFEDDDFVVEDQPAKQDKLSLSSYWYNQAGLERLKAIQADLEAMAETGKVLSLASTMSVFENLRDAKPLDDIDMGFLVNVVPDELQQTLFKPYISPDGNQVHINIRVFESAKGLDRNKLIDDIRSMLITDHG